MIYDDEKTWDSHKKDWDKLTKSIVFYPKDVTQAQHDYRMKIIYRLIKDYEVMNKHE